MAVEIGDKHVVAEHGYAERAVQLRVCRGLVVTVKPRIASPCNGRNDSGGGVDEADALVVLVRNQQTPTEEGDAGREVQLRVGCGLAVSIEPRNVGPCNGSDESSGGRYEADEGVGGVGDKQRAAKLADRIQVIVAEMLERRIKDFLEWRPVGNL